jgi:PAS domain S-box-containing protein
MRLFFRDWPLRLKILVVLLVTATVPLLITLALVYRAGVQQRRATLEAQGQGGAALVAGRIDEHLRYYQKMIHLWASAPAIINHFGKAPGQGAPEEVKKYSEEEKRYRDSLVKRVEDDSRDLAAMAMLHADGRVALASNDNLNKGKDLKDLPGVREALATGEKVVGEVQFVRPLALQPEMPVIPVVEPIQDGSRVVGLVAVWLKARRLEDFAIRGTKLGEGSIVSVLDHHGIRLALSVPEREKFLYRPTGPLDAADKQRMITERRFGPDTAEYLKEVVAFPRQHERAIASEPDAALFEGRTDANGEVYVGVASRLETGPRWTVFFMFPEGDVAGPVTATFLKVFLWCGPVVLLFLIAGVYLAGRILRPVHSLTGALRQLGGGDLSARVSIGPADELGELAAGFNAMAGQLDTNMRALTEREAHIRAIMDTAGDGIITLDERGTIESFNAAAVRMFGYRPDEAAGHNVSLLLDERRDWTLADIERQLSSTETMLGFRNEFEARHKDGRVFPVELALAEIKSNGVRRFTATFHDLTKRKQAEDELRRAKEAAEQANSAKSQFLANMSHELRTPLNVIINYAEMLMEEAEEQELPDFLPDLKRIHASGKHQLALINDILDMSKIEAGRIDLCPERFDVPAMIADVATTIRPVVEKNNNVLAVDCDAALGAMYSDLTRVRQCLFNLLSNAGKFTEKGTVALRVACQERDGQEWLSFSVRDTGLGMTPAQLAKLFKPFTQADASTTRQFGGTGLGLAISLRLSEMMGGTIEVSSEKGQGSTFTLHLPRNMPSKSAERPAATPAPAPAAIRQADTVLVVDDDPSVRDILQRFLTSEGFRVITLESGDDVVRVAREVKPRAITLDVMMPGTDGWAVLSALKNDPALADIPVVMLSIVDDRNLGYALGASEYLTKPLDRDRLLSVLKKYCVSTKPRLALVVEDDVPTRELLRRMLEKDGWEVQEAGNGRVALECVEKRKPSLILLDLMMPEMDGFEFVAAMRQHADWKGIPVVVITAKDLTPEDRLFLNGSLLLSGHVKRVLEKGKFSREDLLNEVRHLVAADRT